MVEVLLFARLRETFGQPRVALDLPAEARAQDILDALHSLAPELEPLRGRIHIAADQQLLSPDERIAAGQEVAAFPPVGGG